MKAEIEKLHSGVRSLQKEKVKSGSELFDKLLFTEFGEFCLSSFVKGCIRNSSDLEIFKSKHPEQNEIIMQIFNYLLESDVINVNDHGYFNINNYVFDLTLGGKTSDEESDQIRFLYSEKVKKMSLSALRAARNVIDKKPYVGNMVFVLSDHPDVEAKKSLVTSEIIRLLRELSDFDGQKIFEGYKPKKLTNLAFIGAIANLETESTEVLIK